jgi:hypothetical protein
MGDDAKGGEDAMRRDGAGRGVYARARHKREITPSHPYAAAVSQAERRRRPDIAESSHNDQSYSTYR